MLLVDGVFLLRPELIDLWDLAVFVEVDAAEALRRALDRDGDRLGSREVPRVRYEARYRPAQQRYLEEVRPRERADVVLDNTNPAEPYLRRR